MTETTNTVIQKLKKRLKPEEYQVLVDALRNEPNAVLSQMSEMPTEKTESFIKELSSLLSRIETGFNLNRSGVQTMAETWEYTYNLAELLSKMELNEIKFVLSYILESDDGESVFLLMTQHLDERLPQSDYETLRSDERFKLLL